MDTNGNSLYINLQTCSWDRKELGFIEPWKRIQHSVSATPRTLAQSKKPLQDMHQIKELEKYDVINKETLSIRNGGMFESDK